jgi:glutamate-1-semialdehyde 2,1-aminomutase
MAGGIAALTECLKPGFYDQLALKTERFTERILEHTRLKKYPFRIFRIGSIFWLSFTSEDIRAAEAIDPKGMDKFKVLHAFMLENGVYFGPSGYEVGFISSAHSELDLEQAAQKICDGLDQAYSA